jgi:hypothetical protein
MPERSGVTCHYPDLNVSRDSGGKYTSGTSVRRGLAARLFCMPVFINDPRTNDKRTNSPKAAENQGSDETQSSGQQMPALVDLLRNRSYAEIRQRMYDKEPGSPWWAACRAELDLRNGQQLGEASLAISRTSEKMRASVHHFEQLAETLHQATLDIADQLRGIQDAGRRLEIAVYVVIGVSLVQFFNLVFEIFRKH